MKDHWSSRFMFILAAVGSAVGLGNIWRFSYMAGEYGGGSFILVYILSVLLIGIPIMILEFTAGRHFSLPLSQTMAKVGKNLLPLSIITHLMNFIILSYYVVVTGWTLAYFTFSVFGLHMRFSEFTQMPASALFAPLTILILFIIIRSDLKNGVEKANKVLMPLFFVILAILLAYALTLPGLWKALAFYASFGNMTAASVGAAVAQVIFSLSIGTGIMLTYGAYLKKTEEIATTSVIISITDTAVALIAGIVVFSIVFTYGFDPAAGPELAFDTLPQAFALMPLGGILMPIFFFLLFCVAITSAISMAEVAVADISARMERAKGAAYFIVLLALASMPSLFGYSPLNLELNGTRVLDYLDGTFVVNATPLVALLVVLALGWKWDGLEDEISTVLPGILARPYMLLIRFVVPVALGALAVASFLA